VRRRSGNAPAWSAGIEPTYDLARDSNFDLTQKMKGLSERAEAFGGKGRPGPAASSADAFRMGASAR
jgi:hypothetical protein